MFCTGKWLIWTKSILSCSSFSWTFLMKYNNTPMIYCITCKYSNTWMLKGLYIIGCHCALTCSSLWSDFHVRVKSLVKSQSPLFHWLQMLLFPGTWFYRWKLFHKKKDMRACVQWLISVFSGDNFMMAATFTSSSRERSHKHHRPLNSNLI